MSDVPAAGGSGKSGGSAPVDHLRDWHRAASARPKQRDIFGAQVRMIYQTANPGVMHILLILVVGAAFWGVAETTNLALWVGASLAASVARMLLVRRFNRIDPPDSELVIWDRVYLVAVFITGILWGASGFLLYPEDDITYQVVLAFCVGGISASATASLSPRLVAIRVAVAPALGLLTLRFLMDSAESHLAMAILLILYFLVLMNIGRSMHQQVVEALSLRFENKDLVDSLEQTVGELDEARREAEQSNQAKTRFLASASHDLRQPVHALRLFAAALGREHRSDAEVDLVGKIDRSLDVISELLDSLLDVSKLDAGIVEVRRAPIDLKSYLSQIANEFEGEAEEKGLSLRLSAPEVTIISDRFLLGQIVRNLLANAIRYTAEGGVLLAVRRGGDMVRLEVWDTGPGISEEHVSEIFQEFFQLKSAASDRQGGLGLGLSIVKRTSDLLEHDIAVCSRVGQGSRFSLEVPVAAARTAVAGEIAPAPVPDGDFAGLHVLLAEDDPHSAEAMQGLLGSWGFSCTHVTRWEDVTPALDAMGQMPDLIVTDYRLPDDRTGRDVIATVRGAAGRDVPAVIITGDTGPERLRELSGTGQQLLHKPVQPARLRAVLRHVLPR
ncbi:hybrid sensor histidine kinase/response regulator [Pyruvatibacter mobilis]|uniref:ATP-binding response regulator n=1 Tax=Pyruvatibacter mobilis TaxID=1712261 RepID=UPI003BA9E485